LRVLVNSLIAMPAPTIVWFRQDLRLADNPALAAAIELGGPVVPIFVWSPHEEGDWPPGGAARWWLHHSLAALDTDLRSQGSRLIYRMVDPDDAGGTLAALESLVEETGAAALVWNRRYEPAAIARDSRIKSYFKTRGLSIESCNGSLLWEPHAVANQQGKPFQVFTPFWKHCQKLVFAQPLADPLPAPVNLPVPKTWPVSAELAELKLLPVIDWAAGMRADWRPGEAGATGRLHDFLLHKVNGYKAARDVPAEAGTSRLSPHLHFGEIGPRQIWQAVRRDRRQTKLPGGPWDLSGDAEHFLREVAWREFAHHLLYHFPHTPRQPLREPYANFPWRDGNAADTNRDLHAWQRGQTGYPLVDAGMRELWHTGWMHNRVRMITASFLVKHLLIDWRTGAEWFWDTLVDADLANNTLGWQWTAGCGADAAPYFRIFNPITQGEKFDGAGTYVRRWVPELAKLPDDLLNQPWTAPNETLQRAGVELGKTYPRPIVDHPTARAAALAALATITAAATTKPAN